MGASVAMNFTQNELSASMAIEKIKILGGVLELPATLDSGINVAPGINVAHGTFGKNIKRSP